MKKSTIAAVFAITMLCAFPARAGWETGSGENANRWKYKFDDRDGYDQYAYGWNWIDGNNDGIFEHYYFDNENWMLSDAYTPDFEYVNKNGARVQSGYVVTIDKRNLPVTPCAAYNNPEDNVFSYITFSLDELIDHGTYYELPNQKIYREVSNPDYFECESIYTGSVYVYKRATCSYPDVLMSFNSGLTKYKDLDYVGDFQGTYSWTLFDMDDKGYYSAFSMIQLP